MGVTKGSSYLPSVLYVKYMTIREQKTILQIKDQTRAKDVFVKGVVVEPKLQHKSFV